MTSNWEMRITAATTKIGMQIDRRLFHCDWDFRTLKIPDGDIFWITENLIFTCINWIEFNSKSKNSRLQPNRIDFEENDYRMGHQRHAKCLQLIKKFWIDGTNRFPALSQNQWNSIIAQNIGESGGNSYCVRLWNYANDGWSITWEHLSRNECGCENWLSIFYFQTEMKHFPR